MLSVKRYGAQKKAKISPRRVQCMYCGMLKDICLPEVASSGEKIKPVAFGIIELHLSEGNSV